MFIAVVVGLGLAPFVDFEKVIGTMLGLSIFLPLVVMLVRWLEPTGAGHDDLGVQVFLAALLQRDNDDHVDSP